MPDSEYDVVVVGSGPAGSAAAATAARAGLRCLVIDKARFPRDKLCGGGFTERSHTHMRRIFARDIDPELFRTCDKVRFTAGDRLLGDIPKAPPIHMTMRRSFDAMLHDRAVEAGAEARTGTRIDRIDPAARSLRLAGGETVRYGVLIGADGVNSFVARTLFGRAFDPARIGFALEVEAPRAADKPDDVVEIDFRAARWGYGWVFPKNSSITIGVGGIQSLNDDMKRNLHSYLDQHGWAERALPVKGQFIPAGDFRETPGQGAILLAGDAAGFVDPITGEGIAHAMHSGEMAAQAAAEALAQGRPEAALDLYKARVGWLQDELRTARRLRAAIFPRPVHRQFLNIVAARPGMQMRFLQLLAGELDYRDIRRFFFLRLARHAFHASMARLRGLRPSNPSPTG